MSKTSCILGLVMAVSLVMGCSSIEQQQIAIKVLERANKPSDVLDIFAEGFNSTVQDSSNYNFVEIEHIVQRNSAEKMINALCSDRMKGRLYKNYTMSFGGTISSMSVSQDEYDKAIKFGFDTTEEIFNLHEGFKEYTYDLPFSINKFIVEMRKEEKVSSSDFSISTFNTGIKSRVCVKNNLPVFHFVVAAVVPKGTSKAEKSIIGFAKSQYIENTIKPYYDDAEEKGKALLSKIYSYNNKGDDFDSLGKIEVSDSNEYKNWSGNLSFSVELKNTKDKPVKYSAKTIIGNVFQDGAQYSPIYRYENNKPTYSIYGSGCTYIDINDEIFIGPRSSCSVYLNDGDITFPGLRIEGRSLDIEVLNTRLILKAETRIQRKLKTISDYQMNAFKKAGIKLS